MKVTTAVIGTAGFGSRMLPVSAGVQKELLPILNRPTIDYVVQDCIAAGVTNIIFVIRPGSHALQDLYVGNPGLQEYLVKFNKQSALEQLEKIHHQATYAFVEQPVDAGYGTAIPLQAAAAHLKDGEAFIYTNGDDPFWQPDGGSDMADLVQTFESTGADGALIGLPQPAEELHRYGVLDTYEEGSARYLRRIVEKPAPGEEPSNLANPAKYVLSHKLLKYVMDVQKNEKSGEYYVTDAIGDAAKHHKIAVHAAKGIWLDAGNVTNWLKANILVASKDSELSKVLELPKSE